MKQTIKNILIRYLPGTIIFTLHRVSEKNENVISHNENLKVSPTFLEKTVKTLAEQDFAFISLDELYGRLQDGISFKKAVVFTLDDGYKDNYTNAYPIFKKYNVPFTIYIATALPNNTAILWWDLLADLIKKNDILILNDGTEYNCSSKKDKENSFLEIREKIMHLPQKTFKEELFKLFGNYEKDLDWYKSVQEYALSWDEIKELSKDELVTIGGHTVNHLTLRDLSNDEIFTEIVDANKEIESIIDKKVEHFAYPFGGKNEINKKAFEIVKQLDLKTATTTNFGKVNWWHKNKLEQLPRIMLTEDVIV